MKKITINACILASLLFTGSLSLTSCREEFTEKDALVAQQTLDLSIYAFDAHDNKGVSGATVTIISEGKEVKQTTNEGGVAVFPGIKIGRMIPVKIEAGDYAISQAEFDITTYSYRTSQDTKRVRMFSVKEGGANLATVKGKVEIEYDLLNDKPEYPAGKKVTAVTRINDNNSFTLISREATIDDKGNYSLTVPTIQDGTEYQLLFQNFEADQEIAKNGHEYDAGLPVVKPSIAKIRTTFAGGSQKFVPVVRPVFAVIPAPDNDDAAVKVQAKGTVSINSDGKLGFVYVEGGRGYKPSTEYTIAIESMMGGSGAEIKITSSADGRIYTDWYYPTSTAKAGSGYPTATNLNSVRAGSLSLNRELWIKAGQIHVINASYGAGVAREGVEIR
jgi:hypothetical protein